MKLAASKQHQRVATIATCAIVFLSGCKLHTFKDVQFHLVDAESNQPIADATITINYQGMAGMIPNDVAGQTEANGLVRLRVARDDFAYILIDAPGFEQRPTDPAIGDFSGKRELPIYRLPLPYHVLLVASGTRGLVELRITDGECARLGSSGKPPTNGQRAFQTTISTASVAYAPTLPRMGEPYSEYDRIFAANFDDGRNLPLWCPGITSSKVAVPEDHRLKRTRQFSRDSFGLWLVARIPLGWGASRMLFYAGTLSEAATAQKRLAAEWQQDALAREVNWAPPLPSPRD